MVKDKQIPVHSIIYMAYVELRHVYAYFKFTSILIGKDKSYLTYTFILKSLKECIPCIHWELSVCAI